MLISASVNDLALEYSLIAQQESQSRQIATAKKDKELKKLLDSSEMEKIRNLLIQYEENLKFINTRSDQLNAYISYLFWDKSISLSAKGINDTGSVLGNPDQRRVSIDQLSSGEEGLLSLLVYNAARNDSVFIIDEPELYLHPDWQREIIRILKEQHLTHQNQFCIATHSPAIASSLHSGVIDLDAELRKQGFDI
jgi:predicted ATPase